MEISAQVNNLHKQTFSAPVARNAIFGAVVFNQTDEYVTLTKAQSSIYLLSGYPTSVRSTYCHRNRKMEMANHWKMDWFVRVVGLGDPPHGSFSTNQKSGGTSARIRFRERDSINAAVPSKYGDK